LNLTAKLKIVLKTDGLLDFTPKRLNIMNFIAGSTALKAGLKTAPSFFLKIHILLKFNRIL
jgi:hypothetical protein